jgi:hypothetical protein
VLAPAANVALLGEVPVPAPPAGSGDDRGAGAWRADGGPQADRRRTRRRRTPGTRSGRGRGTAPRTGTLFAGVRARALAAAWAEGERMSPEQAVADALADACNFPW